MPWALGATRPDIFIPAMEGTLMAVWDSPICFKARAFPFTISGADREGRIRHQNDPLGIWVDQARKSAMLCPDDQKLESTTPPSTRKAAPVVADDRGLAT